MPSSDHCYTETVPPSSDHYGTTKIAPPSDGFHVIKGFFGGGAWLPWPPSGYATGGMAPCPPMATPLSSRLLRLHLLPAFFRNGVFMIMDSCVSKLNFFDDHMLCPHSHSTRLSSFVSLAYYYRPVKASRSVALSGAFVCSQN